MHVVHRQNGEDRAMDHSTFIQGVRYPNRVFVGGLPREAAASDLADFFSRFGRVTESKVILNEDGTSKGYGFITFSTSEEVKCVFGQGVIFYKKKKLNLGPAIRKQAPETPGEPVLFVRTTPSTPLPSPPQLQMPPQSPVQIPPTSPLPPQHCYQQVPLQVTTLPELFFRQNYSWYSATA